MSDSTTAAATTSAPPTHHQPHTESPISLGWILGIVFVCVVLAQIFVLGCYYLYKRDKNDEEHKDRVSTMHSAFMEAVENERMKSGKGGHDADDRWGSYSKSGLQVQREAPEA